MCVKIIKEHETFKYDSKKPIEPQIKDSKEIIISYEPKDPHINKFVKEMEKFSKNGTDIGFTIKVEHNNNVMGSKLKKSINKITHDISVNELIKLMALNYDKADKELEKLANYCMEKSCNVK